MSQSLLRSLLFVVPAASALMVVLSWLALRFASKRWARAASRAALAGLVVCALGGLAVYTADSLRRPSYFNTHEFFHYYLPTKYAKEVGYTGMYVAAIRAMERQGVPPPKETRDLSLSRRRTWQSMVGLADRVEKRFSPERWAAFQRDVKFFYDKAPGRFPGLVKDRGYNGTPIVTLVNGTIASLVPTSNPTAMNALAFLDVGLLVLAFGGVAWAFGLRSALIVALVLFTQMVTSHSHMKGAFLRTDWIVAMLLSMCALKRQRPALAGALLGYAALVRIFPAVFGFAIGCQLVWGLIRRRRVDRRSLRFFVGMGIAVAVGIVVSLVVVGVPVWREFVTKIAAHNLLVTEWRIGFKFLFMPAGEDAVRMAWFAQWSWLFWLINAAILALLFPLTEALDDDDVIGFGFVVFFFLVATAYYYYIVLLVPALWYASRLERAWAAAALASLFAFAIYSHRLNLQVGLGSKLFIPLSTAVLVHVLFIVGVVAARWWTRRRAPLAHASAGAPVLEP